MLKILVTFALLLASGTAYAETVTATGTIETIDAKARSITVLRKTAKGDKSGTFSVSPQAKVLVNGEAADLGSLEEGETVTVTYDTTAKLVTKIEAAKPEPSSTPADAMAYKEHAYKVFAEVSTWHQAKRRCEELDGHLATISSKEEESFVLNLAKNQIKSLGKLDGVWLGGTDEAKEGEWEWVDGSQFAFKNWGTGQPNNKREVEHYLLLLIADRNWSDQPDRSDQHTTYFVCEWDNGSGAEIDLFNGKDLTNWSIRSKQPIPKDDVFSIKPDGVLHCSGKIEAELCTTEDFNHFVLRLEYRLPPGGITSPPGSGVVLRHVFDDDSYIEAQIVAGQTGDFWIGPNAKLKTPRTHPKHPLNRLKLKDAEKRIGEWNAYEITCDGDEITLKLNGTLVNRGTDAKFTPGPIGLRSQGTEIEFRRIRLTRLDD